MPTGLVPAISRRSTLRICRCSLHTSSQIRSSETDRTTAENEHRSASASAYLSELAKKEEVLEEERLKQAGAKVIREKAWDGDEAIQDAVLRMLVDQYKPLRVKGWVKEHQQPTSRELHSEEPIASTSSIQPDEPPKPGSAPPGEYYPWMTEFRAPSHHLGLPSIRHGVLIPKGSRKTNKSERIMMAREASMDYTVVDKEDKSGERYRSDRSTRRPLPNSIAGWNNLVEERIQEAQSMGLFKKVKGRGKPFAKDIHERNPHLDKTEYLMNRIVQRQGAAPPWIELQGQVEASITTFRSSLRDAWIRRAIRMLTLSGLAHLTPAHIHQASKSFRDSEWEAKEKSFLTASLKEINNQLRMYNTIAPYITRRAAYTLDKELLDCYKESTPIIKATLEARVRDHQNGVTGSNTTTKKRKKYGLADGEEEVVTDGIWQAVKRLFTAQ